MSSVSLIFIFLTIIFLSSIGDNDHHSSILEDTALSSSITTSLYKSESLSYSSDAENEINIINRGAIVDPSSTTKINQNSKNDSEKKYIVKTGDISILVRGISVNNDDRFSSIQEFSEIILNAIKNKGGYIASRSDTSYSGISLSVQIPVEEFDEFIKDIPKICQSITKKEGSSIISAKVNKLSTNAVDETSTIADWNIREKSLRTSHEKMLDLVKKANDIKDIIEIEKEISRITQELERILALSSNLIKKAQMSRIIISIQADFYRPEPPIDNKFVSKLWNTFYDAWVDLSLFFQAALLYTVRVIVYIFPLLLIGLFTLFIKLKSW